MDESQVPIDDPRMAMFAQMRARQQAQDRSGGYTGGLALPAQMQAANQGSIDQDQIMRNRMMQNQAASIRPQQGTMAPMGMGRQPMAPSIQQQANQQSNMNQPANPVAGQSGTPANVPMAGQMNRQQMMQRRMGNRMGMQRPQQSMQNPNTQVPPRSVSSF